MLTSAAVVQGVAGWQVTGACVGNPGVGFTDDWCAAGATTALARAAGANIGRRPRIRATASTSERQRIGSG